MWKRFLVISRNVQTEMWFTWRRVSTLKQQNVEDLTNMWVSNAMSTNRSSTQLSRGDIEGNSDLLSSKREGNLANFQDQETTIPVPYAWSGIQMMLCQLPTCLNDVLAGPQKGRSLLVDDGALTWLIENSSSTSDGGKGQHLPLVQVLKRWSVGSQFSLKEIDLNLSILINPLRSLALLGMSFDDMRRKSEIVPAFRSTLRRSMVVQQSKR
ncbi:hypothetical protein Ancab_029689 [Ancistrocladus abbreviatus]